MGNTYFDNPPILKGQAEERLQQLYSYLENMSGQLNAALMTISIEQMEPSTKEIIYEGSSQNQEKRSRALKDLIIKTANIVRTEMAEIRLTLDGQITAISEQFGIYEQNLEANITATANGILQDYHFQDRISGLEEDTEEFFHRINQYIFTGLIDPINMKYGIAIGQHITREDGTLDTSEQMATFTMNELAFYQGANKVAWLSSQALHITEGVVTGSMTMGSHIWKVLSDNSLALLAGGGE